VPNTAVGLLSIINGTLLHYWSLSMHSCKSLIACDNVFFSPILSLKAHSYHATPVALLQSRVLMPFVDSSSIDDKSCSLVLMRIVQYHYLGTAPPVGAAPPLPAQLNQPLDSFVSHHRILLVASSRNPIHPSAIVPIPNLNLASADSTRRVGYDPATRSGYPDQLSSALVSQLGFMTLVHYFSVSGLRLFRCCDLVFVSICATTSTP
jgi:hypothetical protein